MVQTCDGLRVENYVPKKPAGGTTYISGDTADDDLLLASGLDGGTEVSVIPGIDLATPTDDGGVGVHIDDLREERTVRAFNMQGI